MKKQHWESFWGAGLLLFICGLAFGIHLGRLGFYWDDYASLFVWRTQGSGVFADWFGGQGRPLGGWLSGHLWDLFGEDPLAWQALNFLLYVASVGLFWRIVRRLWPEGGTYALMVALLFAVYPSYHLRPVPISFSLAASQTMALLSLYFSLRAAQNSRPLSLWTLLAAGVIPFYPLIYEQNLGYEALRPLMLFYVFYAGGGPWRDAVKKAWAYWWPCLIGGGAFFAYRAFIFSPNPTYATYNQADLSLNNLLITARLTLSTPTQMLLVDWIQTPYRLFVDLGGDIDFPALCAVIGLFGLLTYVGRFAKTPPPLPKKALFLALGAWLGMMALLLPIHLVGRALDESFNSRWALSPAPLAALILGLTITWALPARHSGVALVILVAWGVLIQAGVADEYAQDWQTQQTLVQQIAWRAPDLEPYTVVVLLDNPAFAFERQVFDYELTPLLAGEYDMDIYPAVVGSEQRALNALLLYEGPSQFWGDFRGGGQIFRRWTFNPDSRLIWGHPGQSSQDEACWRIAEPGLSLQSFPALAFYADYQTPDSLQDSPIPPDEFFPDAAWADWCFYYQRIQWALQFGHWDYAGRLADEAQARGLLPDIYTRSSEWAPLVWTYYRQGRFEEGEALSRAFMAADSYSRAYLCEGLAQIPNTPLVPVCEL